LPHSASFTDANPQNRFALSRAALRKSCSVVDLLMSFLCFGQRSTNLERQSRDRRWMWLGN